MASRARLALVGLVLLASVTGCPLTDDYFIEPSGSSDAGSGGSSVLPSGGSGAAAGTVQVETGGAPSGEAGQAAEAGSGATAAGTSGSGGTRPCIPSTERCNGRDDDCDEVVDEEACNSPMGGTFGCSGFVIDGSTSHGYMFCAGQTREYEGAQAGCQSQGMRLAWLESKPENAAVWAKVNAIQEVTEVWIGATDGATEGSWFWDGPAGAQFWQGDATGSAVGDAFVAWAADAPNNSTGYSPDGEDCAVLLVTGGDWGDRTCNIKYPYLCEDVQP